MTFKEWLQNRYKKSNINQNIHGLAMELGSMYDTLFSSDNDTYGGEISTLIRQFYIKCLDWKKDNEDFRGGSNQATAFTLVYYKFYDHEMIRDDEDFINEMFKCDLLVYNAKLLYFVNSEMAMINDTISPFTTNTREENGENQALNRTRPIDYNQTAENLLDLLNADNVSKNGVKLTTNEVNELKATLLKRIQSDYRSCIDIWLSSMEYIFKQVF